MSVVAFGNSIANLVNSAPIYSHNYTELNSNTREVENKQPNNGRLSVSLLHAVERVSFVSLAHFLQHCSGSYLLDSDPLGAARGAGRYTRSEETLAGGTGYPTDENVSINNSDLWSNFEVT